MQVTLIRPVDPRKPVYVRAVAGVNPVQAGQAYEVPDEIGAILIAQGDFAAVAPVEPVTDAPEAPAAKGRAK